MTDRALPPGVSTIRLDARSLRGLAHPLRVRLLGLLRERGPATASGLARIVGESSGVTSYHLRQLADHGFVVEDAERGSRRERWWKAAHRTTVLEPLPDSDPETELLVDEYLRYVTAAYADRMLRFADGLTDLRATLGPAWEEGSDLSDWSLELTPEQSAELAAEVHAVLARHRVHDVAVPVAEGHQRVVVQLQVMPMATHEGAIP